MASDSPAQPAQHPPADARAASSSRSASFVSADLNVRISGRIVADGEAGRIEGLQVELDQGGITVKHPQLLSVQTKPEAQTLSSVNTGERLLTLPTPFMITSSGSSDLNEYEDTFEVDSGASTPKKTVVTLHEGFLPASETEQIEQSPLFSSTFKILIDSPSFPAPHFDPASLAPPTPSVRPLDPTSASSAAAYGGILNSPTLQRALLSPLLSPQRRAASQGSDLSVPPLSLGLSRTSRASFSGPSGGGERPRVQAPSQPSLASLIPALAPPASGPSTASSSSTDPAHTSAIPHGPTLASTLTHALSAAAKKIAEEIISLRRAHDTYQRRAKAELEVLEQRIELARQNGGDSAEGVVRGFKTREEREKSVSASRSRERAEGKKEDRSGSTSRTRAASSERRGESTAHPKSANMDEEMSSRIREQDEREDEERGRSRSRSRGGPGGNGRQASVRGSSEQYAQSANAQRSSSRTKAVAEATAKAVEGAQQRGQSGSRERAGQPGSAASEERSRGRGSTRGENLPATLEEEGEEDDGRERSSRSTRSAQPSHGSTSDAQNNLLSPTSAAQATRGPSSSGATPTFIPSSHALVAIPESEELSLPPSEAGDDQEEDGEGESKKQSGADREAEESDPPFEMDEDVDVEELDIGSSRQPAPLESPSLEIVNGDTPPPQSVAGQARSRHPASSSSFRPGSYQRASALSASYNALLASPGALAATKSPLSPATVQPISPSVAAIKSYGSAARNSPVFSPSRTAAALDSLDTLPPFSPPEAHAHLTASARDDAENALAAATFEHATLARSGDRGASGSGPDPREVRRGEQKIRDVLAMDVPSHRPRNSTRRDRRVSLEAVKGRAAIESDIDDDDEYEGESAIEDGDDERMTRSTAALGVTAPAGQVDPATNAFVGSLPIALGRPSTINAALSSWRPDPERLWAQQRRERKTSVSSRGEAGWVPPLKTGSGAPAAPMPTQGGRAAAVLSSPQQAAAAAATSTRPLEIGSPSTPRPVAGGSSLAQSLRHASFSHRAALDDQGTNGGDTRANEEAVGSVEDDEDEDDGEFVPPHLVGDRKGRRSDEALLSRSVSS